MNEFLYRSIFVDTNVFIYYLTDSNYNVADFFEMAISKKITLVIRVIDELYYKIMLIVGKKLFNIEKDLHKKIKQDRDKIFALSEELKKLNDFFIYINLDIKEISKNDLLDLPNIMKEFGVFGNDALIIKSMKKYNIKYLLTRDRDFEKIDFIKILN